MQSSKHPPTPATSPRSNFTSHTSHAHTHPFDHASFLLLLLLLPWGCLAAAAPLRFPLLRRCLPVAACDVMRVGVMYGRLQRQPTTGRSGAKIAGISTSRSIDATSRACVCVRLAGASHARLLVAHQQHTHSPPPPKEKRVCRRDEAETGDWVDTSDDPPKALDDFISFRSTTPRH